MANNSSGLYVGDLGPFEIEERTRTLAEGRTQTVTLAGKISNLSGIAASTGDIAPDAVSRGFGGINGTLYVLNSSLKRTEGEFGTLELTLVEAGSVHRPYLQTATVDLQAVELSLLNHPKMRAPTTAEQIHLWECTDENIRWNFKKTPPMPKYVPVGGQSAVEMTDEWAIKYARARLYGLDKYTVYFPVVEITSRYIRIKGISVDNATHEVSGTFNAERLGELGTYCDPPFDIAGFQDGLWFKAVDRFSQDANGGWSRVEQYVYTNDKRFQWIYDDKAIYEVIEEEEDD